MFLDLDSETSFSVGLRSKIDAFLILFLTVQYVTTPVLFIFKVEKAVQYDHRY